MSLYTVTTTTLPHVILILDNIGSLHTRRLASTLHSHRTARRKKTHLLRNSINSSLQMRPGISGMTPASTTRRLSIP
jgi:cation transporter-like permease